MKNKKTILNGITYISAVVLVISAFLSQIISKYKVTGGLTSTIRYSFLEVYDAGINFWGSIVFFISILTIILMAVFIGTTLLEIFKDDLKGESSKKTREFLIGNKKTMAYIVAGLTVLTFVFTAICVSRANVDFAIKTATVNFTYYISFGAVLFLICGLGVSVPTIIEELILRERTPKQPKVKKAKKEKEQGKTESGADAEKTGQATSNSTEEVIASQTPASPATPTTPDDNKI